MSIEKRVAVIHRLCRGRGLHPAVELTEEELAPFNVTSGYELARKIQELLDHPYVAADCPELRNALGFGEHQATTPEERRELYRQHSGVRVSVKGLLRLELAQATKIAPFV